MKDFFKLCVLQHQREQRLKTVAKFTGRDKTQDVLIECEILKAQMDNLNADWDVQGRFLA